MPDITLSTPSGEYTGWESIRVNLALDQMSGSFELSVSGENARELIKHPLTKGLQCRVKLDGETVITGYINRRSAAYEPESHTLTLSGRDVTCDLIDCSAVVQNQELHNVTIAKAAIQLIAPFPAITLDCPAPGAPFDKFVINDGATIYDVLSEHAKQRGLMIYSLGDGVLRIRKPSVSANSNALIEGVNIIKGSAEDSDEDLFNRYIMRFSDPDSAFHKGLYTYTDSSVRTGRVRIIDAEKADKTGPKNRAQWEAKLRQARSQTASISVQGWAANGRLWRIGDAVPVQSPALAIAETLLINAITYNADEGTTTDMELVRPEVYVNE